MEEAKKNKGQDKDRQEDTQAKEEKIRKRENREEKLEWELVLIQRRSRRKKFYY